MNITPTHIYDMFLLVAVLFFATTAYSWRLRLCSGVTTNNWRPFMRLRLLLGVAVFVAVGVVLPAVLAGPDALLAGLGAGKQPISQGVVPLASNAIVRENAQLGTSNWEIPSGRESSTQIQAYADGTSATAGQKLTFYVSTQREGTSYSIGFYRLGWYQGYGGRLMGTQGGLIGHAQGYYDAATHHLVSCTSCLVDRSTGLVEANWKSSYTLSIPGNWITDRKSTRLS